jgi:hypothetical protein
MERDLEAKAFECYIQVDTTSCILKFDISDIWLSPTPATATLYNMPPSTYKLCYPRAQMDIDTLSLILKLAVEKN